MISRQYFHNLTNRKDVPLTQTATHKDNSSVSSGLLLLYFQIYLFLNKSFYNSEQELLDNQYLPVARTVRGKS